MRRVRKSAVTSTTPDNGLTGREIARLAWLHLIARRHQRGHPGLFALAVAPAAERNKARWLWRTEQAARRFRDAAAKVTPDDWRAATDRLRKGGTIPA